MFALSRDEWDKDFCRMLDQTVEIPLKKLEPWYRGDDNRQEMVATALANDKIGFRMTPSLSKRGTFDNKLWDIPTHSDLQCFGPPTGYKRVVKIKDYMARPDLYLFPYHFMVEAASLRRWLSRVFSLEPEQEPSGDQRSGNEKVDFANECFKAIYPNGYKLTDDGLKKQYDDESKKIENYLDKNEVKERLKKLGISGRAKDALKVQLNPVKK